MAAMTAGDSGVSAMKAGDSGLVANLAEDSGLAAMTEQPRSGFDNPPWQIIKETLSFLVKRAHLINSST